MYEASKSCSYTKNIKINESSEVLRYVEKNSHQNIQLDLVKMLRSISMQECLALM